MSEWIGLLPNGVKLHCQTVINRDLKLKILLLIEWLIREVLTIEM
jgi:hypothetical protein